MTPVAPSFVDDTISPPGKHVLHLFGGHAPYRLAGREWDEAEKERFAAKRGLKMPLLADPDRRVAALYGAKQAVLGTKRSTFVIDGEGVIRFRHDATLGLTYLSADELRAAIAAA